MFKTFNIYFVHSTSGISIIEVLFCGEGCRGNSLNLPLR